jgi:microcystin-dependent protein
MDFFLGQIGIYGFNFAPKGWALCIGTILPIQQNSALYALLGTTYGGNGTTTFGLPDLRSRAPIMFGQSTSLGEVGGVENVTLTTTTMAAHTHRMNVNNSLATASQAQNAVFAGATHAGTATPGYGTVATNVTLNAATISQTGGSAPHTNIQPSLAVNFCIATVGIFPSRN